MKMVKILKLERYNKGVGAGGANTTINGKAFEQKTSLTSRLLASGFKEIYFKLVKTDTGFKLCKTNKGHNYRCYKINGMIFRHFIGLDFNKFLKGKFPNLIDTKEFNYHSKTPDELIMCTIGNENHLYILEKKCQSTPGSVDEKLKGGFIDKKFWELWFPGCKINYCYVINGWLKKQYDNFNKKPYKKLIVEHTPFFYGDDDDYQDTILKWIFDGKLKI